MIAKERKSHYVCIKCGETKPEIEFPIDRSVLTKRKGRCRECVRADGRKNYIARKERRYGPSLIPAPPERKSPAKVLILDIETTPLRSYTWGLWKQNIAPNQIISDWFMLTWAAKWLFEEEVLSDKLTASEAKGENDLRISRTIWSLLDQADIVIAHNAHRFDIKKLNTRFVINGLNPPMPYQVIDTLDHLKRRFAMSSNRLDYVNKRLDVGRKMDTGGFELWDGCVRGNKAALKKMEEYNRVDVKILEETYLRIRPWIKPHPNMGLFIDNDITACPTCGSEDIVFHGKPYATTANLYHLFRCVCGAIGRSKKAMKNNSTTRSVPK